MRRRQFLAGVGLLSLGVELGCDGTRASIVRHAERTGDLRPNAFVTVKRDGRVGVEIDKAEIGQGVTTMYATLVAEELEVDPERVDTHYADSLPEYRTATFGMQITGGSGSTRDAYVSLRRAAAAAREMLVGAAAAIWDVPRSDCRAHDGFVVHASGKKLDYGALTTRAAAQPIPDAPRLKSRREFRLIGKRSRRLEIRSKIDGSARFGIDTVVPGMLRAAVVHGPTYGANATSVRAETARSMPGVVDVVTFHGGVAVVAEKYWQAVAAARTLTITWDAGTINGLDTSELRAAVHAFEKRGDTVRASGDANEAIEGAHAKLAATYEAPYLCHAPMEPQNCTVHVRGDKVEVWAPTQTPSFVQGAVGRALGVAPDDVLVHTTLAGGSFGRRLAPDFAVEAALIARQLRRPVQMIWSRESDMTQAHYRPISVARMRAGIDERGRIAGFHAHVINQGLSVSFMPSMKGAFRLPQAIQGTLVDTMRGLYRSDAVLDELATEGIHDTSYTFERLEVTLTPINTKLPVNSWRSVGHSFTGFVMESFIDELAHVAKSDPLEFRQRILRPGSRARRVLDAVTAFWRSPRQPGVGRGLARHTSFDTEVAEVAEVEIVNGRIKVRRVYVAIDCGTVVNPDIVRAQVEGAVIYGLSAALDQEITLTKGIVQQTNFDTFPALRMYECPEIVVNVLENDEHPTGVGEPGLPPIAPAVANAVFDLTGKRLRRLPLQAELER